MQDVRLGHLHPLERERAHHLEEDRRAGNDRRRTVRIEAGDLAALGGHGELVSTPGELRPALERAFESGKPALVNVLTDPSVAYPRKANLA